MFPFENTYKSLPDRLFSRLDPSAVKRPELLALNDGLASDLGLDPDALRSPEGIAVLAGNDVPTGAEPIALAYAGHQFGGFVPRLGDGRALLLGELVTKKGRRFDVQLKGSGPTPYSRGGDGRASLGPVLREYLVSEAMHALGIATTRALAAVSTGEPVFRERPLPGAVLTRVASSHLRVGSFEYAAREGQATLEALMTYAIERHFPQANDADNRALALFDEVVRRQTALVAQWMGVGFIHGVMNTDNTAIGGETIDYGPCAFLDTFDRATVFSSIDEMGRYAYGRQPVMLGWNMARLAEALLPLLHEDRQRAIDLAQGRLDEFGERMHEAWLAVMRLKLGLFSARPDDLDLIESLLLAMEKQRADFTNAFRALCDAPREDPGAESARPHFDDPAAFDAWTKRWRERLKAESQSPEERRQLMRRHNPAFIPRNHRVEEALKAGHEGDLRPFEQLLSIVTQPFDDQPEHEAYQLPASPLEQAGYRTFCGT